MSEPEPQLHPSTAFSEVAERKVVWLLCCLAAAHVFFFSAAFPFFNNVDEYAHFDLVLKYSGGHIPRKLEAVSKDTARCVTIYNSPEFFWPSNELYMAEKFPPPWTQPMEKVSPRLLSEENHWVNAANHEFAQAPLYYALAGLWWDLGQSCGLEGGRLLYWVRFLNIVFVVALVWLGYRTARMIFPENHFLQLGVPAMLAFLPQSAFYSINNDVLTPLCFGAAFLCLVRLWRKDTLDVRLGFVTGLALATTYLAKISNLPLFVAGTAVTLFKIWRCYKSENSRASQPTFVALALTAGLPVIGWLVWCKLVYGDFTSSAAKIQNLGWTHKPFADWWHHPIFTPNGLWLFVSENLASFWRGELIWHHKRLALPGVDCVYAISTICFLGIAVIAVSPRFKLATAAQRQALLLGFGCCLSAMAFLGFLSIIYDFHDCVYPSRAYPYFTSGRLMLGALIPFLLLFIFGLDCALKRLGAAAKFSILVAIILFMLASEIAADWPVFSCPYNWFHL